MKKISGNLLLAGMTSLLFALAGSTSPAYSKCIQKHPIFGIDVYLEDKYCPKKVIKKNAVTKTATPAVKRKKTTPVMVAKPDDRIRKMQSMLASMGYNPGPIDGYDGPETRKAAGEFNISNDLPEKASTSSTIAVLEGLMGNYDTPEMAKPMAVAAPATFESAPPTLATAPALTSAPAPVSDSRVRKMQTLLAKMGYNPGPADGMNTPATRQAAGEFNIANDLPEKASTGSTIAVLSALTGN